MQNHRLTTTPSLKKKNRFMFYGSIAYRIRLYAFSICLNFVVTLTLFPGFFGEMNSTMGTGDWFPIIIFSLFDIFDALGRVLAEWTALVSSGRGLLIVSISRMSFIPLVLLCVSAQLEYKNTGQVTFFAEDFVSYFLSCALALTNGYFASLGMKYAPTLSQSPLENEAIGAIMALFLMVGLTMGSFVGFCIAVYG